MRSLFRWTKSSHSNKLVLIERQIFFHQHIGSHYSPPVSTSCGSRKQHVYRSCQM